MSDFSEIREIFKERNACVLIPTYNNAQVLPVLLQDILQYTDRIIVVNDGSTDETAYMLERTEIETVSFPKNRGKGWALRQGFKKAVELGYTYAITIDSDGQHFADDLEVFLKAIDEHPNSIIIGARNMEQSSVPGKSSFGNKFSNFWFWVETGIKLPDTQSGYRAYPVKALSGFNFITRKYEFEIEVIVRAAWKGIGVRCVPVKVFYPEKANRISHFRPFRDFLRISVLNTMLVAVAFLYIKPRDFFRR
ncbi:MAG TPA: glycosyltransferase family 2 protein, partial [Cyclobacteriaceae bacterium]|nr:glycosyltransferase family 2 protein [Cyclobacteriaceae bacterium]